MRIVALALEVQDGVDDVLQRFRPGQAAVLRHMADQQGRHVSTLRRKQQVRRRVPDLANAARRGLQLRGKNGLDGVDDDEGWVEPCDLLEHALEAGLREHIHRRPGNPEPLAS